MAVGTSLYSDFLESKSFTLKHRGISVADSEINPILYPFQRDIVRWSLRKGRSALFEDCGLGKTFQQLEWARLLGKRTLIIAPLSVAKQTVKEGRKIDIDVHYTRSGDDITDGINITNYEMVERFDPSKFEAVVLDESSILKGLTGKTRQRLTTMFAKTPYRLCCTATPAPNDITEIANHAEFLGVMTRANMLASFFVHDDTGWRLKKHAIEPFYRWLASWAMAIRFPSDLGYSDEGFILPKLRIIPEIVEIDYRPPGKLFWDGQLKGIQDRAKVRKATRKARVDRTVDLVDSSIDQWILWCGLNAEADTLHRLLPDDSVNVKGSQSPEQKQEAIDAFLGGEIRVLITKCKVAGFGMNFQNCHKMAFVGLNDSYEMYYQAIRRCYRFGQTHPVDAHIVLSDVEYGIYENVLRKEEEAKEMSQYLIENVKEFERAGIHEMTIGREYKAKKAMLVPSWLGGVQAACKGC
ncbi:MAG TPA: DEAD/DEAH box helicase [Clostridiaceae bacterium]|nr:DEAD/DEAH box helicase [Clostridiaceae bacterium]